MFFLYNSLIRYIFIIRSIERRNKNEKIRRYITSNWNGFRCSIFKCLCSRTSIAARSFGQNGSRSKKWNDEQGNPSFLSGKLSGKKVDSEKAVKSFLEENKELFKINPQTDLTLKEIKSDDLGMKHYVYIQSINKVPVDGARFIVHTDRDGKVTTVNGDVHPAAAERLKGNTKAKISNETALSNAWKHINLAKKIHL